MKAKIRIVQSRPTKRGKFIAEGNWDYFSTAEGLPAMECRWQGLMFAGPKQTFVFPRDVLQIGRITDKAAKSAARWSSATRGGIAGGAGGLLTSLISAGIGAAAARTGETKGFAVAYKNSADYVAVFLAVAPPEIVDEIFRAVPGEKHEKTDDSATPSQPTTPPET